MNLINIQGGLNKLSYGYVTYNILKELRKETRCTLWQIGPVEFDDKSDQAFLQECINRQKTPNFDCPTLKIWHQFDLASRICGKNVYWALPIFEMPDFDSKELAHLKVPNGLLVTSEWGKQVLKNHGLESQVVPLGVDEEAIAWTKENSPQEYTEKCRFISVGKYEIRKGFDILIEAFNNAFRKDDEVLLQIAPSNLFLTPAETKEWDDLYMKSDAGLRGQVEILPRYNTHKDILSVMNQADVYVTASRAEGWNLPLSDALALKKPCIAANHTAQSMYFPSADSCNLHIQIDGEEPGFDSKWFFGTSTWATLNVQSLADNLRQIYEHWQSGGNMSNFKGLEVGKKYTWKNTAKRLKEIIFGNQ